MCSCSVDIVVHRTATIYCDVYNPISASGHGEFLLSSVRIFGSDPKGPHLYPCTATVVTRKNTQYILSVPLLDDSTTNSIYFYIHQMAAPQLLHQALPNSSLYHSSKSVTHFTAQSLHMPVHTKWEVTI
ncbi:hypothetical protein AVEN_229740-1 [Araneus ventricosus]|uniref:Uncharacterized protein n=1 Tax=Araneus ventricosus TaxID=182803 RepID=A0A4Y2HTN0_ARAVE|nr:hypothetical protein AVEN_229740-1 [Araneus ventricosus]